MKFRAGVMAVASLAHPAHHKVFSRFPDRSGGSFRAGHDLHEKTGSSSGERRLVFMTSNNADFEEDETGTFTLHFSESVKNLC